MLKTLWPNEQFQLWPHVMFSKSRLLQRRQKASVCGKGLNAQQDSACATVFTVTQTIMNSTNWWPSIHPVLSSRELSIIRNNIVDPHELQILNERNVSHIIKQPAQYKGQKICVVVSHLHWTRPHASLPYSYSMAFQNCFNIFLQFIDLFG